MEVVFAKMNKEDEVFYRAHPQFIFAWWIQQSTKEGTLPQSVRPEKTFVFPPWYRRDLAPFTVEDEYPDDDYDNNPKDEEEM